MRELARLTAGTSESPLVGYREPAGRWVLLATVLGSGVAFIDGTVVNIALPRIGTSLHADAAGLQWTVNGYTLSLAALILLGGSLGDQLGRRRIFIVGVVWFAAASLVCALAPSIRVLVAARVLQGVGGAMVTPGALAILEASFRPDDRGRAIGAWSGLAGIAGALGPFLGGWLVDVATWRLVFLINVPIAVVIVLVAKRHVPETRNPAPARRVDVPGVLTAAVALGGLAMGFTAWPTFGFRSAIVLGSLGLGAAGLVAFVLIERHSEAPMLPLRLFESKPFAAANLVTFVVYAALSGVFFLTPLELQVVAGFSPLEAGAALIPITILMLLLSSRMGDLARRIGPRLPMTWGPLLGAGALVLLAGVGPSVSYATEVLPGVVLLGFALSLFVAPLTATAVGSVDHAHAGIASGVNNAVARTGGLLAVAVLPLAAGLGGGSLTDAATLAPAYRTAMLLCAGLMVAGSVTAFTLVPVAGSSAAQGSRTARAPTSSRVRYHCAVLAPPLEPRADPANGR